MWELIWYRLALCISRRVGKSLICIEILGTLEFPIARTVLCSVWSILYIIRCTMSTIHRTMYIHDIYIASVFHENDMLAIFNRYYIIDNTLYTAHYTLYTVKWSLCIALRITYYIIISRQGKVYTRRHKFASYN